jgi:hypothetical protein
LLTRRLCAASARGVARLQALDLEEGEVERVGVNYGVLDALAARVRNMPLERRGSRGSSRLLEQKIAVGERRHDIVGQMPMPPPSPLRA